ncbi:hypothetical protein MtrunA17_Chr4g0035341 [Medicago truncatula]|uniref:Uncharacterized protein n=1 Tax=Medicago truncatula TaxID=3880 RepID=A0A396I6R8_MEDTR|nr:hypothetical protein MtrunA17_Chr4g0035341 [Medicago truncatula]
MSLYAINMNDVSLFEDSSFLFLETINLYCVNELNHFELINIVYLFIYF